MAILVISSCCLFVRFEFKMILTYPGAINDNKDIGMSVAQTAIPLTFIAFGEGMSSWWHSFTVFFSVYLWPTIKTITYIGFEIL
jgi:hypothetical protein